MTRRRSQGCALSLRGPEITSCRCAALSTPALHASRPRPAQRSPRTCAAGLPSHRLRTPHSAHSRARGDSPSTWHWASTSSTPPRDPTSAWGAGGREQGAVRTEQGRANRRPARAHRGSAVLPSLQAPPGRPGLHRQHVLACTAGRACAALASAASRSDRYPGYGGALGRPAASAASCGASSATWMPPALPAPALGPAAPAAAAAAAADSACAAAPGCCRRRHGWMGASALSSASSVRTAPAACSAATKSAPPLPPVNPRPLSSRAQMSRTSRNASCSTCCCPGDRPPGCAALAAASRRTRLTRKRGEAFHGDASLPLPPLCWLHGAGRGSWQQLPGEGLTGSCGLRPDSRLAGPQLQRGKSHAPVCRACLCLRHVVRLRAQQLQ